MTRSGQNHAAVPSDIQRASAAVTDDRIVTGKQLGTRMRQTTTDRPALCLEPLARNLQALAQQIDSLGRTDHMDAGQFMHLDRAARYTLAATHAINAAGGAADTSSEQGYAVRLEEPALGQIEPELAESLITRIFAAGLHLTALQSLLGDGTLSDKAAAIVEELDLVIRDIRVGVLEPSRGT